MLIFEQHRLGEVKHLWPEMQKIIDRSNTATGATSYMDPEFLPTVTRRNDLGILAFQEDRLVGFTVMSPAETMLTDWDTIELRIWLAQNGYQFSRLTVDQAFYLDPDLWGQGLNKELMNARKGNGVYDFGVIYRTATPQLHAWFAKQDDTVGTGIEDIMGQEVLVQDLR